MDPKKMALLVAALMVAGVTAFAAKSMFSAEQTATPSAQAATVPENLPEILVATRSLPIGTIIEKDSFRYQPWPKELIDNAYYKKGEADPASLAGTVVRTAITAGQPVTKGALVSPDDRGFLAAALGPGMRAVSIPVTAQAGVAGFIFPGDRVDVVLTQTVESRGEEDGPPLRASETIVRNVRVLATDQRTVPEDEKGDRVVQTFATITLEVTPRIAEKIAVAQSIGQLSLALRSIADNTAELERAIASGEVKVPNNGDPKAEKRMLIQVASRPIDTDTTFVVGADVSRFSRRSIPAQTKPKQQMSAPSGFAPPSYSPSAPSTPMMPGAKPVSAEPTVRVARGKTITDVPVGGN
jgi:Flp pilus assembly protein CpaB